jgi:putative ABC transport system permease protein
VAYDYLKTLGIELVAGRAFSPDIPADLQDSVIVNEAFIKRFKIEDPINQQISQLFKGDLPGTIIGVVKDFHYEPLTSSIRPAYIKLAREQKRSGVPPPAKLQNKMRMDFNPGLKLVYVKVSGQDLQNTIGTIKKDFLSLAPDIPFNYSFLDERVARQYANEKRWGHMVNYASLFAILLACSGLFGLSLFTVVRRTKEIGIRRVLGASVTQITSLINREFIGLVLIANVMAWPAAYFAMRTLLQNYAYRISLGPWLFLVAGLFAALIAVLTISFHAIRAARANPVNSLRFE